MPWLLNFICVSRQGQTHTWFDCLTPRVPSIRPQQWAYPGRSHRLKCRLCKPPLLSERGRQKPYCIVGGIQVKDQEFLGPEGGGHVSRGDLTYPWIDFLVGAFPDPTHPWTDLENPLSAFPLQTHPACPGQEPSLGGQMEGSCGCKFQGRLSHPTTPPALWNEQVTTACFSPPSQRPQQGSLLLFCPSPHLHPHWSYTYTFTWSIAVFKTGCAVGRKERKWPLLNPTWFREGLRKDR